MSKNSQYQSELDDDVPIEYKFSGTGVRGMFAKILRENGYSVTICNDDGTTSTRYVSPAEVIEQNRQRELLKQQSSHHTMAQEPHQTWTKANVKPMDTRYSQFKSLQRQRVSDGAIASS